MALSWRITTGLLSRHLQHQQLPHWDAVCLSLRLQLNTAAAAATAADVQQQSTAADPPTPYWHTSSTSTSTTTTTSTSSSSLNAANHSSSRSQHRAKVLDGKAVAGAWSCELQRQAQEINRVLDRRPGLAVVLVGNRPDSLVYVARKQEACK